MKLMEIHYKRATPEDVHNFRQWQKDCRIASENATFTGTCEGGCQAVDWMTVNNAVVGDWDPATMQGQVYPQKQRGQ